MGCAGILESKYKKWSKERRNDWKCSTACRDQAKRNLQSPNPSDNTVQLTLHGCEGSPSIERQLSELCANVNDLVKSAHYQSEKLDDVLRQLVAQEEKIKSQAKIIKMQEQEIEALKEKNIRVESDVKKLKVSLMKQDQYSRNRNIEIHGVQERVNENLQEIIESLGQNLKLPMHDIDKCHRLSSTRINKHKKRNAIIVQFKSRSSRDQWIQKRKTGLSSNNLVSGSDDQLVYINVNLCQGKKELFWKAKQVKLSHKYQFCWTNDNGDIFLKKSENSPKLLINSEEDLPVLGTKN